MPFQSTQEAAGYLAALIDGEGSVTFGLRAGVVFARQVRIWNTDEGIIRAGAEACDALGIEFSVREFPQNAARGFKPAWELCIARGDSLRILLAKVSLHAAKKHANLVTMVSTQKFTHGRRDHPSGASLPPLVRTVIRETGQLEMLADQ